jgi:hypothetical protein
MNKKIIAAFKAFILICAFLAVITCIPDSRMTVLGQVGTSVGGILWDNATWTLANSPYTITSTVQIPENVTLTIEPGVAVNTQINDDMFLLHGIIVAQGTVDEKIVFDGGNTANFFNAEGSTAESFLDMDNCIVKNGKRFWWEGHGYFSLRNSELINLIDYSYIWYPEKDVLIEHNTFMNTAGFSIGNDYANVSIINNFFTENRGFVIKNWASYGSSRTLVRFNSFLDMEGVVLELEPDYSTAEIVASENYWGTTNTSEIDTMIYDKNDDLNCAGFIDYLPILTEAHPDTPVFSATPEMHTFEVTVETLSFNITAFSNSTISDFSFNQTAKELKFNAKSLTGTTGFCNVSIPADFMWGTFTLYMDDTPLTKNVDYTETSNGTHYLFSITYEHSNHTIKLVSTEVVPDFASWLFLPFVMSTTLLALALKKRNLKTKHGKD